MRDFLVHLHSVLTSDPALLLLIQPANIGAAVRQNSGTPLLEYGVSNESRDHTGHLDLTLTFMLYSQAGAEEAHSIKEAVESLMTAKNLTPAAGTFKTSQVRLVDSRNPVRNSWTYVIQFEYGIRVVDARPRTQKQ